MIRCSLLVWGAVFCSAFIETQHAFAQVLYSEDFDADHSTEWLTFVAGTGTHSADFFFDYSTVGIPAAPHSTGTSTRGLKLQANMDPGNVPAAGVVTGVSVSPVGGAFTGDYRLRFDMWLNYNGPLGPIDVGGSGSTQITGAGIGTAAGNLQIAGRTPDAVYFGASADGGSIADYRAYSPASGAPGYQDDSGIYAAPDDPAGIRARNNSNAYYASFGGASAPAEQLTLFPGQAGTTAAGAQGFAWREVVVEKINSIVTFRIDSILIATIDSSTFSLGGENILFNHFDINNTVSADPLAPSLLFGLIDNIFVEQIPEPATTLVLVIGMLGITSRRKRTRI